jgi:hypothetical protein
VQSTKPTACSGNSAFSRIQSPYVLYTQSNEYRLSKHPSSYPIPSPSYSLNSLNLRAILPNPPSRSIATQPLGPTQIHDGISRNTKPGSQSRSSAVLHEALTLTLTLTLFPTMQELFQSHDQHSNPEKTPMYHAAATSPRSTIRAHPQASVRQS